MDDKADESRVSVVDDPIEGPTPPADLEIDSSVESAEYSTNPGNRGRVEMSTLDGRDGRLSQAGGLCQVDLTPAAASADRPNDQAHASVVHRPIVGRGA
jgi:hypothetical protein